MRETFDGVHHFGPLGDHGISEDRIERAREFLRREEGMPLRTQDERPDTDRRLAERPEG